MKIKRYRIVKDGYCGYECQVWRLWFPFWVQMGFCNTHVSVEDAEAYIEAMRKPVVKYITSTLLLLSLASCDSGEQFEETTKPKQENYHDAFLRVTDSSIKYMSIRDSLYWAYRDSMEYYYSKNYNTPFKSPKPDIINYDSAAHRVWAGIQQKTTIYSVGEDLWYVETNIWTGSKERSYTLEEHLYDFVPKSAIKSTLKRDSARAYAIVKRLNKRLTAHPIYN